MITADDHLLRMGFQMPVDERHKPAKLMKEGCLMICNLDSRQHITMQAG